MARSAHRGPVVAVFPDGAHRPRAFGHKSLADLAGPRRGAGGGRPRMARGWNALSAIPERGDEGEERPSRRLLLLERRTAAARERAAVVRDGRDPTRVRRSRGGVLDNALGHSTGSQRADVRFLFARQSRGPEHPGWTGRPKTRRVDRRADESLEIDQECLRSAQRAPFSRQAIDAVGDTDQEAVPDEL